MRIHKEGRVTLLIIAIAIVVINYVLIRYVKNDYIIYPITAASALLYLFVLYFFRVVDRPVIDDQNAIIAPCDGRVVVIEKTLENQILNEECMQISIFMSPLDVHMNWYPIAGKVTYNKIEKGKHLVAWAPKSSTENERSIVVIEKENGLKILLRQIAGAVARRVVCYANTGDQVEQNGNLGFIKFGSRVDVLVPLNAQIKVDLNEKVVGTQTVLARFDL